MNILVLGGTNNTKGELSLFTKKRCEKAMLLLNKKQQNYKIHFSGGFNKKFNKTDISHANICKSYFLKLNNVIHENELLLHEENNNTVDEAIYFGNYFKTNNYKEIIIITNDWHYNRVKYLFNKVFNTYNITSYNMIGIESENLNIKLIEEEKIKLDILKNHPYGTWEKWLKNNI